MRSLDELLAPLPSAEFREQFWNQKFLLQAGDEGRFAPLLPWSELNHMLQFSALQPPRVRLVAESRGVSEELYMESGTTYPHINIAGMTEALSKGATLVVDRIDHLVPKLYHLANDLQRELRCGVGMNLYASWRTQRGFDLHWDKHDVMVLQLYGPKHWTVYEPTRIHPLRKDVSPATEPTAAPVWEGNLEAGSLLYLPRGWWHVAQAVDQPSLHITVGLTPYTGVDMITFLADGLRDHPEVRQDLPHLASEQERGTYAATLAQLLSEAASGDLLQAFEAARMAERMESDLRPSLPEAPLQQLQPMTPATRLRLAHRTPLNVYPSAEAGQWRLKVGGKEWPCDDDVLKGLRRLSYAEGVSLGDLNKVVGGAAAQLKLRMMLTVLQSHRLLFLSHG